ncbi:hypothetical protein OF83DRAFT_1169255 [Amylostereum chailletii]|nr:hypothetical protein OF83DRAFT_1169255 [Amylostereum chailletii]
MLLATVIIFGAATTHWASQLRYLLDFANIMSRAESVTSTCLSGIQNGTACAGGMFPGVDNADKISGNPLEVCVPTVVLTINIVLSDAIVLWRAWILWSRNRVLSALSIALLVATLVTAAIDTHSACTGSSGQLFGGDKVGLAVFILSFVTNVWSTSLIGFKAWQHRRVLKENLQAGSARTRVEKVLALLVESGAVYCVIWAYLVTYQIVGYFEDLNTAPASTLRFNKTGWNLLTGGLIQLIGIYPTIVVVLVCLEKTHCDRNFTYDQPHQPGNPLPIAPRIPLRHITVDLDSHADLGRTTMAVGAFGAGEKGADIEKGLGGADAGRDVPSRENSEWSSGEGSEAELGGSTNV